MATNEDGFNKGKTLFYVKGGDREYSRALPNVSQRVDKDIDYASSFMLYPYQRLFMTLDK